MKTRFIKLFTVALAMSMAFVGCSNDDEKGPGAKDIQKEYAAEEVVVKFGEEVINGATVKVNAVDDKNIVVTLNNVVAGFATFDVDAAVVTTTKAAEYAFAGEKTVGEMKISIAGTIVDGKVAINVTNKITSSIVGEWGYYKEIFVDPDWGLETVVVKSIALDYANAGNQSTYHFGNDVFTGSNAEFCANTNGTINVLAGLALSDVKITLTADGYISASAKLIGEDKPFVAEKAARYTYDSEKKMLYIALPLSAEISALLGFTDLPLACEIKDGNLCANVQYSTLKRLIGMLQELNSDGGITKMVKELIVSSMPEDLPIDPSLITNLVEDIFGALSDKTTTKVELGLKMAKYVAPVVPEA